MKFQIEEIKKLSEFKIFLKFTKIFDKNLKMFIKKNDEIIQNFDLKFDIK